MDSVQMFKRTYRVWNMYGVLKCYEQYKLMMMYSTLAKHKCSFKKAEKISNFLNDLFKAESAPTDFLGSEDQYTEDSLKYYEELKRYIGIFKFDKETIMAFCKAMYHYPHFCWLNNEGYLYMGIYCAALYDYMTGGITKKKLEESFIVHCLWDGTESPANFSLVRKTFVQAEELYYSIACKQVIRKHKKNGKQN